MHRRAASTTSTKPDQPGGGPYRVLLTDRALEALRALDPPLRERVRTRLKALGEQPRGGPNCEALVMEEGYRVRIGSHRAIYIVRDDVREVRVTRILKRNESTYR